MHMMMREDIDVLNSVTHIETGSGQLVSLVKHMISVILLQKQHNKQTQRLEFL
jgi:hypothetical protein